MGHIHEVLMRLMMPCSTVLPCTTAIWCSYSYCSWKQNYTHHYYVTATNGSDCPLTFSCHPMHELFCTQNAASCFTANTVVEYSFLYCMSSTIHMWQIYFVLSFTLVKMIGNNYFLQCCHSDSIDFVQSVQALWGNWWMVWRLRIYTLHITVFVIFEQKILTLAVGCSESIPG